MKFLSKIRRKKGLTQAMLAEKVGISLNSIARYERGEVMPSANIARLIAEVLDCTESELLNGTEPQDWNLRLITTREAKTTMQGVIDLTGKTVNSSLEMSDDGMGLTLSASYDLWEDDVKFENLLEQIRHKRAVGLRIRREDW